MTAMELIMHRIVWSAILCLIALLISKRFNEFKKIFHNKKLFLTLIASTILVSSNWFIFIWAVNNNHILETSLGYYILPMLNMLVGSIVLKEKLSKLQKWAVIISSIGVFNLVFSFGDIPWISLGLALTFGLYGLVRKLVPVDSIMGLTYESFLLFFPGLGYLIYLHSQGQGHFGDNFIDSSLLFLCGAVTLVPLLLYLTGLRRLKLTTMGFLQFIVPTTTFILAVFVYDEPFQRSKLVTFAFIWASVLMYLSDLKFRKN